MAVAEVTDWRFTVGVVSGGHLLSHFYKIAFPPLFPLLQAEFGLSTTQLGLIVTVISAGSFLQVPLGLVVDRVGGKQGFLLAVGLTSAGVLLVGAAGTVYPAILAFAALSGLGQAAFHPSDYALLAAATDEEYEGKSFATHNLGGYVGLSLGPVVVGWLGYTYGWREALLVTGAVGLAFTAFAALTVSPVHRRTVEQSDADTAESFDLREFAAGLLQPTIVAMAGFFALFAMANNAVISFAPLLSIDVFGIAESVSNATLTVYSAAGAVGVLAGGLLADRHGAGRLLVGTSLAAAALTAAVVGGAVPISLVSVLGFFAVLGLFTGLVKPARDSLVNSFSAAGSTGTNFGVVFTGGTVGAVVSPVLVGAVIDAGNPRVAVVLVGVFFLLAAVTVGLLSRVQSAASRGSASQS